MHEATHIWVFAAQVARDRSCQLTLRKVAEKYIIVKPIYVQPSILIESIANT